jgi:glycosyltransferase involved in cell wall biosynthesis
MNKVTVIILTYNEEMHIAGAIESVLWADEILVVDSYSTDHTTRIAAGYPAVKILQHHFENHGKQRNWAIPQAWHEWILVLDADERVPLPLQEEIQKTLDQADIPYAAFSIGRINFFMGKQIHYSGWQNDRVIRLFRREECRYNNLQVHEKIETKGKLGSLEHKLIHYTFRSLRHYLQKFDQYSTSAAYDRAPKTRHVGLYHLLFKPFFRFFKQYFIKLGILDGKPGFIISALASYSVFLRYLKCWRILEGEELKK